MSPVVLRALVWVPVALFVAIAMDLWAALLHRRAWHGWLWTVHRSHHVQRRNGAHFEANDALSMLHAPVAITLILVGCCAAPGVAREVAFGVGAGMSFFGVAYLVVHDGLVHGRLPVAWLRRLPYLRKVARAHRVHHAGGAGGPPYGLFFGPWELARRAVLTRGRPSTARARDSSARRP
jgi:beta-carotene 3-hydroxylase